MTATTDSVQRLYIAYFNRPADPIGLQYWVTQIGAGQSVESVANNFARQTEYSSNYTGLTSAQIVNTLYQNLFGHQADFDGLIYWATQLEQGTQTIGKIALSISLGAIGPDKVAVDSKISAATAFTGALDQTQEVNNYAGTAAFDAARTFLAGVTDDVTLQAAIATTALNATVAQVTGLGGPQGQSFALTAGIDTIVGTAGNDTFNASNNGTNDFFSALDSVTGGAGTDTINVALATGILSGAGSTVTGVEIANVVSNAAITAANVSTWTGLTTLNVAAGGAVSGVVAAATADINVANGLAGVTVNGGKNVTVVNGTAGNVAVGLSGTGAAAAGDVTATNNFATGTVSIRGAGALAATSNDGAVTFINGTSVNATALGAVSLATRVANLNAQTSANSANTAALADSDASGIAKSNAAAVVTDLGTLATAITNATNVSADQTTALSIQLATKTAYDNGALSLADKVAIDAAFSTGLVTSLAAARTAAQAVLTPLQATATTASAAAAAADVINDAAALAAKNAADAVVTADNASNALVDGVTVDATTNTALVSATVNGNHNVLAGQIVEQAGTRTTITDNSATGTTLTNVTLINSGNAALSGNALTSVTASDQSGSVAVTNSTVGHTQNFTLSGIRTGGTYSDAVATTVNIVSNGAATNVLSGLTANLATKINVSGAAGVSFGTLTADAAAIIDASANSGSNTITLGNAGQKYIGGSGADTVTATTSLQTATVDGGAGTADQIIFTNAATFATTGASKFLNFETLRLTGITADVTAFTGSTFTSVQLSGAAGVTGLAAGTAANITALASGTYTVGITGASTVGQLDTVNLTVSDGLSARNTLTLTTPVLTGVETLNLVATDNIVITSLASATALTSIKVTGGTGTVNITGDIALNVNTIVDASGTTRGATLNFSTATANGVSLIAGDGDSTLTGTDIAGRGNKLTAGDGFNTLTGGQADDVIVAGHGNNTVTAAAGNNTVTLGNGDNSVTSLGGNDTITVGNGLNVISSGAGNDKITVGTGGNLITAGAGADTITFGAHVAGVIDGVVLVAADSGSFATTVALASAASTGFTTVDVITGLHAGDTIDLTAFGATITGALGTTIASGTGATAALTRGNYDATTGIFTASATGTSTLLSYDEDGSGAGTVTDAIVLVGSVVTGSAVAGLITLA